jgi:hypothetical protein
VFSVSRPSRKSLRHTAAIASSLQNTMSGPLFKQAVRFKIRQLHKERNVGNVFTTMAEITTRICGVTIETLFKKAVLFKDAHCDDCSQKCLEAFASYGLRPTQIVVRSGDQTFNYDLSFSLFNGNGTFRISAEKLDVSLQNATTEKDVDIVQDCIAKVYEHVPLPEINNTSISATAHATFPSIQEMQQYLLRYANPAKQIVAGGTIAYILCQNWPEEIRLTVEKSLVYPEGLFLAWSTVHRENKISRDVLKNAKEAFENSLTKLDLTVQKTN